MTFCYLMTCKFVLTLFTCQVYFIKTVPGIAGSAIHSWRFLVYGLLFYLISSRKCKAFHSTSLLVSGKGLCSKTRPSIPCYPEAVWLLLKKLTVLAFSSKLLLIDSSPCPYLGEALPYGQWIISSAWYLWLLAMHWEQVSRTAWLIDKAWLLLSHLLKEQFFSTDSCMWQESRCTDPDQLGHFCFQD